jgi:hypothetical protein
MRVVAGEVFLVQEVLKCVGVIRRYGDVEERVKIIVRVSDRRTCVYCGQEIDVSQYGVGG